MNRRRFLLSISGRGEASWLRCLQPELPRLLPGSPVTPRWLSAKSGAMPAADIWQRRKNVVWLSGSIKLRHERWGHSESRNSDLLTHLTRAFNEGSPSLYRL
jgi:hypothetical protein